jgi:hypothetical protein
MEVFGLRRDRDVARRRQARSDDDGSLLEKLVAEFCEWWSLERSVFAINAASILARDSSTVGRRRATLAALVV